MIETAASAQPDDSGAPPRLNAAQREAVTTTEGHVRVIAGAGTGKTRALTERFAYLVNELGIMPGNILCATFTNKAAGEMRRRIRRLTGDNDTGYINTFHGFCVSVLQEDAHALQYPKSFLVLDSADIDAMLQVVYEERGLTLRDMTFAKARDMIEIMKLKERPGYYRDMLAMPLEDLRRKYLDAEAAKDIIFYGYLYQEKKCFGLDYNDLIVFVLYLFEQNPAIRSKWQRRLEYVMVDEFQDIDGLQHELMEVLAGYHKNLFVVGDPDQTIYTWRGADVRYLLDFDKRFPGTHTVMMLENYRSAPRVVAVANSLIEKNRERMPKRLVAVRSTHGPTVWHHAKSAADEAAWIAQGALALHGEGVAYRDMAVLYRAHYASRPVEEALLRAEVPHVVHSGVPFFGRREIKDALSYLRLVAYRDDLDFARVANVPKRNLGQRRMAFLRQQADERGCSLYEALARSVDDELFKRTKARQLLDLIERFRASCEGRPVSEVLAAVLSESGYERMLRTEGSQERLDNLAELKQSVYEFETTCGEEVTLEHYLAHVALFSNADAMDDVQDKVRLMTVHAAKGLEFRHVFLCSMSEGVLPSRKTSTPQGMEEERRLAFVAMTRARDGLYLTEAEGRSHEGAPRYPSRFLLDIDPAALEFSDKPSDPQMADARAAYALTDRWIADLVRDARFSVGDRVVHAVFGAGRVAAVDTGKRAYEVEFDGMDTPRTISFKAKLEQA
ncbi:MULTISPECIES: ATP-dependent helicase [Gordonibacter]|uniref:ATP-dependent helicase n=1 Tax=Gordonibacter TaxID=644652 RepID=UPI001D080664|nr:MULTISPECIES: UvrD-helicase domain-containing protein [Gordonibacter]MCB7086777.1 UvrD-helicase domain-containing protein [Gordonibacter urolithinfaciens]